ncbi:MAG: hypothetical protein K6D02_08495 [Lachnospiraceae bacterium]|nr:hypothetical protein [Lachnospiraceae bacterium]
MGKMILCKGKVATKPYKFKMTGTCVYSIEEVCYYIQNNIYLIKEEIFDYDFARWLSKELDLRLLSEKVLNLIREKADIKDIVVTLCCGCDYFTEEEMIDLIKVLDETHNLTEAGRYRLKGDNYLEKGELKKAKHAYQNVLTHMNITDKSKAEVSYVYNRLGTIYLKLFNYKSAMNSFRESYTLTKDFNSLAGYMISMRFGGKNMETIEEFEKMKISQQDMDKFERLWEKIVDEAEDTKLTQIKDGVIKAYDKGRIKEYYDRRKEYVTEMKKEYRKMLT